MESATETQDHVSIAAKHSTHEQIKSVPVFDAVKTCQQILDKLPKKTSRIITDEFVAQIKSKREDFKALRSLYSAESAGKRFSKTKQERISRAGLSTENTSEDQAIMSMNLCNALYLTYHMINETDPKVQIENVAKDLDYIDLGVKANIAFTNFFIALHERHNVNEERLDKIFDLILRKTSLEEDLEGRGLKGFTRGLKAAYKGYLYLAKTMPGWKISTPDLVLDRDHGIDMVATSESTGEQHYYQIKGSNVNSVTLNDVTSDQKMEEVRKQIVLSPKKSSRTDLRSLGNIFDYISNLNSKGQKAKAIWMEVPV